MIHIKTFETFFIDDLQSGDYVILDINSLPYASQISGINDVNFVNTHVGKIKFKNVTGDYIAVEYEDSTPDTFEEDNHTIYISPRYITHISKNKEELELKLATKRYNL